MDDLVQSVEHVLAYPCIGYTLNALPFLVFKARVLNTPQNSQPSLPILIQNRPSNLLIELREVFKQEPPSSLDVTENQHDVPKEVETLCRLGIHVRCKEYLEVEAFEVFVVILDELRLQGRTLA